ncbi:photosystem reaction center subunit H [Sphingomonas metalli]|uniref:Photosystem reaction center subunit H n=2 Tax=Sphingomonas metalli TaxID=1779358 RepID=A0A916SVI6_9SPHN|nr:photosystem reaction center subunit H [Sphingomonas metalli]
MEPERMSNPSDAPTQILIQSNVAHSVKVESRDGDAVGSVYSFMVHKGSGRVTHAVLSLGGFLGMGKSFYPVPFQLLQFDPVRDLYVITIDRRLLEGGPSWANNAPVFDQAYADRVASYYGVGSENLSMG